MPEKNYEQMTEEELVKLNQELMAQKATIREEQRRITKVLDRLVAKKTATRKYEQMSDAEKAVLHQVISGAGSIESEEKA